MIDLLNKVGAGFVKMLDRQGLDNKKILLIILICLSVVYSDYSFVIKFQSKGIKAVNSKVAKLKKDIEAFNKDLAGLEDTKRKKEGPSPVYTAKGAVSEEDVTLLLQDISGIADRHNITIIQIKPSKEPKAKAEKAPAPAAGRFTPSIITIDVSGDYHNLGSFVNDLENARQFMAVQDMKIKPNPKDYLRQNASLALKIYVKK